MAAIIDDMRRAIERLPASVLHIGANRGGEARAYAAHGITGHLIEAIPQVFDILQKTCAALPGQTAHHACLDEVEREVTFNVSSNLASSSLLGLGRHAVAYPDVTYAHQVRLRTRTLDGMIAAGDLPPGIEFAILDVQGAELQVLRGGAGFLASPDLLGMMIEVSADPLYAGGATYLDICRHLEGFGLYTRAVEFNEDGWGDALFARRWWKLSDADIPPLMRGFAPETRGRNIAGEGRASQSSRHPDQPGTAQAGVTAPRGPGATILTQAEPQAFWQLDFDPPRPLAEVILFNALTPARSQTPGIALALQAPGAADWQVIWQNEYAFGGVDGRPLRVPCPQDAPVQALRVLGQPGAALQFNRIEVYEA